MGRKFLLSLLIIGIVFNFSLIVSKSAPLFVEETHAEEELLLSALEEDLAKAKEELKEAEGALSKTTSEGEKAILSERISLINLRIEGLEESIRVAAGATIPIVEEPTEEGETATPEPEEEKGFLQSEELELGKEASVAKVGLGSLEKGLEELKANKEKAEEDLAKLETLLYAKKTEEGVKSSELEALHESVAESKQNIVNLEKDIALQEEKITNANYQLEISEQKLAILRAQTVSDTKESFSVLLEQSKTYLKGLSAFIPELASGLMVLLFFYLFAKLCHFLVNRHARKKRHHIAYYNLIANLCWFVVLFFGMIAFLQIIGLGKVISALLASIGLIGFALGLSLQDILKNVFAGILISIEEPFDINDHVIVDKFEGFVKKIRLRTTLVETFAGEFVFIPNSLVINASVVNCSDKGRRRFDIDVGVAYGSDLKKAEKVGLEALSNIEAILKDPAPMVHSRSLDDSSVGLRFYYWLEPQHTSVLGTKAEVVHAIHEAYKKENIEIPFPQRDIHTKNN